MFAAEVRKVSATVPAFFRYRELDGAELITNGAGGWLWLDPPELRDFVEGRIEPGTPVYERLAESGFVQGRVDEGALAERVRRQHAYLRAGPSRHVIAVTLRSNTPSALFRPASEPGADMTPDAAERVCDTAFMSTSPSLTLELRGGEALCAPRVVRHVIEYAQRKNRLSRKQLRIEVVSNLALLDDGLVELFGQEDVRIRAEVDGAVPLDAAARARAMEWLGRLATAGRVDVDLVLGGGTLGRWRELLDEYLSVGCRSVRLRGLRPLERSEAGEEAGARVEEVARAFEEGIRTLVGLAREGSPVVEQTAAGYLRRILRGEEPTACPIPRSPGWDGVGELAYEVDGRVYSSGLGREAGLLGDEAFLLGHVTREGYHDLVTHPTVRALVMATTLSGQPGWVDSAYEPYAGVSAVESYLEQGSIHGRMADSAPALVQARILDTLFRLLRDGDAETRSVLERWADAV